MARQKRFQSQRPYSASELFIMGGRDQHQAEALFAPRYYAYDRACAAIDSMSEDDFPFAKAKIREIASEREIRVTKISEQVINASQIEAARQQVAEVLTKIYS